MSKKWSCATLGEGFRAVMEESAVEEESQILREIEDPSKSTHLWDGEWPWLLFYRNLLQFAP